MIETLPLRRIFVPHFLSLSPSYAGSTALLHRGESTRLRCVAQYEQRMEVVSGVITRPREDFICNQQHLALSRRRLAERILLPMRAITGAITVAPNAQPPAARRRAPGNDGHRASTWPGYVGAGRRFD